MEVEEKQRPRCTIMSLMRESFDKMLDLVLRNCDNTTEKQKVWYNLNVYERPFQHREQVLIYLKVDSIVARLL